MTGFPVTNKPDDEKIPDDGLLLTVFSVNKTPGGEKDPGEGPLVAGFSVDNSVAVAGAVPLAEGDRRGRGVAGPLA